MPDDSGSNNLINKKNQSIIERLFGTKSQSEVQHEAEEEILSLVDKGQEKGVIQNTTKTVIENIFDFDDTVVSEIMTHRTEMTAVEDVLPLNEIVKIAIESGYSRIPVYTEDIDNIVGVLYVKDLLKFVCESVPDDFKITDVTRKVIYVPKTKNCSRLFAEMTKNKVQMAIIVDEYGGTEGLITMEDLIEEILGNIQDEYDHEEDDIKQISDNKFTVDGSASVEDIEELTGINLNSTDCDTIAGYLLEHLERIPADDEHPVIEAEGIKFTIIKIEDRRIAKIVIEKM